MRAVEYYFSQNPPGGLHNPDWALDHLLAWLHAVLRYVVREERSPRVSSARCRSAKAMWTQPIRRPARLRP